jgi:hypothetical protein
LQLCIFLFLIIYKLDELVNRHTEPAPEPFHFSASYPPKIYYIFDHS